MPAPRRAWRIWLLTAIVLLGGCTLGRIFYYGPSEIDDYTIFPGRDLPPAPEPFAFRDRTAEQLIPAELDVEGRGRQNVAAMAAAREAVAFVVVRGDEVLAEQYYQGYTRDSLVQVFSVTKSILGLLVGCAIRDGYLRGVEQPVTDFVPELKPYGFAAVTIEHLLQMTSGIDYTESDNPFGRHPATYYGTNLEPFLTNLRLVERPGTRHEYRSVDAQLLGLMLTRALRTETVTHYAQRVLWEPLGMQYGGYWATDRPDGLEKTFCCLSMRAIDLAKIGALVARHGQWRGRQVVPLTWIAEMRSPVTENGGVAYYRRLWWLLPELGGGIMASGHLGQYVIVLPDSGIVVVRLGKNGGEDLRRDLIYLARAIAGAVGYEAPN